MSDQFSSDDRRLAPRQPGGRISPGGDLPDAPAAAAARRRLAAGAETRQPHVRRRRPVRRTRRRSRSMPSRSSSASLPGSPRRFAVGTTILLTGGLHEDGLADMADGFAGGGTPRGEARDHARQPHRQFRHAGARSSPSCSASPALASLADIGIVIAALVAGHAASRAAMTAVMHALPNARSDGLSAGVGRPGPPWPPASASPSLPSPLWSLLQGAGLLAIIIAAGRRAGAALAGAAADRRPDRRRAGRRRADRADRLPGRPHPGADCRD